MKAYEVTRRIKELIEGGEFRRRMADVHPSEIPRIDYCLYYGELGGADVVSQYPGPDLDDVRDVPWKIAMVIMGRLSEDDLFDRGKVGKAEKWLTSLSPGSGDYEAFLDAYAQAVYRYLSTIEDTVYGDPYLATGGREVDPGVCGGILRRLGVA